jgi:phenylacetate-CoA ligase
MKAKVFLRNMVSNIPYSIGHYFTHIPFSWRLGSAYTKSSQEIGHYNELSRDEQTAYLLQKLNDIIYHATHSFEFYRKLYKKHGVLGQELKSLEDFKKYPIVTKEMIRAHTDEFNGAMRINTGGTSGEPFSFYIDKDAFAREWAHMHYIWALKGYSKTDIKITLRGKNLGEKNIIYNPVHNEFVINTYKSVDKFKNELLELFKKYKIKYVHGYPSAIYEFFKELESVLNIEEKNIITKNIISCLFGSEFPVPYMVDYLGNTWNLDYISWYGHSEMAILAYDEEKKNQYKPLMTYGYVEVEENKLLGTSYNNFDMPLIRYDTGDRVEGEISDNGVLEYFSIQEGREGDFIIDKNGKKIPLTALVFGRHHKIFDIADFIQVGQDEDGKVTFYITLKDTTKINTKNLERYFELSNVDIDYKFKIVDVPIRSKIGKMKLKV